MSSKADQFSWRVNARVPGTVLAVVWAVAEDVVVTSVSAKQLSVQTDEAPAIKPRKREVDFEAR